MLRAYILYVLAPQPEHYLKSLSDKKIYAQGRGTTASPYPRFFSYSQRFAYPHIKKGNRYIFFFKKKPLNRDFGGPVNLIITLFPDLLDLLYLAI